MGYFDALTSSAFKTSQDGQRIFFPWGVLGRGYIVPTEQQYESLRFQMMLYIIGSLVLAVGSVIFFGVFAPLIVAAALILFFGGWMMFALRGLEPSQERLSFQESMMTQARLHNPTVLWILEVISVLLMIGGLGMLFTNPQQWYLGLLSIALFGYCAWVIGRMIKMRRSMVA